MEQLDQLRTMRDQAAVRLEEARKALETSPDAKLVSSLSSLIEDLESSLGMAPSAPAAKPAETKVEEPAKAAEPAKMPEPAKPAEPQKPAADKDDDSSAIMDKIEKAAKKASGSSSELSLEESLEAELLAGEDLSASTKGN